jgi:hypothetical protein
VNPIITFGPAPAKKTIELDHQPSGTGQFYVYVHRGSNQDIFYVGKGTGNRAWSTDRHPVWHRYVAQRSGGQYTVQIVSYHQTSEEAEEVEDSFIALYGNRLVNWFNPERQFDYKALEQYHAKRDTNRAFIAETRLMEATSPTLCVERYQQALERMYEYEGMTLETGLVAEMLDGEKEQRGDVGLLDRITLCLFRLNRNTELAEAVEAFLKRFPGTVGRSGMKAILKRRDRCNAVTSPS